MDDIFENIIDGLNSWMEKMLDVEERIEKTKDLRKSVIDSLHRQVLDGFISEQDSIELEQTCNLWINLYNSWLCKSAGAEYADRDVVTYLVELYSLKQITKDFCISTLLGLCRNNNNNNN